jgi:hypothetical protein
VQIGVPFSEVTATRREAGTTANVRAIVQNLCGHAEIHLLRARRVLGELKTFCPGAGHGAIAQLALTTAGPASPRGLRFSSAKF